MNIQKTNNISRTIFLNRIIRFLMAMFLAFLALTLGSKAERRNDCSSCPMNSKCYDDTDCKKFSGNKK